MKRYISAILIPCFLLQLCGCYTQKEITYENFYVLPKSEEATILTIDKNKIELTSDSAQYKYMFWQKGIDSLTIYSTHLQKISNIAVKQVTDTLNLAKENIESVYVKEIDTAKTILLIIIPIAVCLSFYLLLENMTWPSNNSNW